MNPILEELSIEDGEHLLLELLNEVDSKYLRDTKLNLKTILKSRHLSREECLLIAIACSVSCSKKDLVKGYVQQARDLGIDSEKMADAISCGSLMSINNVLYRFRHMVGHDQYDKMPAGIRMQVMIKPLMGKELFELASIAVSAINGCESCIKAHEASVLSLGSNKDRIFDSIKIASVVKGISTLVN